MSRLHGSVPIAASSVSGIRSLSSSVSLLLGTLSPSQSSLVPPPRAVGPIIGDLLLVVNALAKRLESTRTRKRVATRLPFCLSRKGRSLAGTVTPIFVVVASGALTNTARPPSRLKTTVFLFLPLRKFLPVTVMTSPMPSFMGETFVTTG